MTYFPKAPPKRYIDRRAVVTNDTIQELAQYIENELGSISREMLDLKALELRVTNAAPVKPRHGMLVEADGTNWNPGAGAGLYIRRLNAWVKIG